MVITERQPIDKRKVVYVTAFEGASKEHIGLYESQVINFVKTLNKTKDTICSLVVILEKKQNYGNLERHLQTLKITHHILRISKFYKLFPFFYNYKGKGIIANDAKNHLIIAREIVAAYFAYRICKGQTDKPALMLDKRGLPDYEVFTFKDRSVFFKIIKFIQLKYLARKLRSKISAVRFVTSDLRKWCIKTKVCSESTPFIVQPTSVLISPVDQYKVGLDSFTKKIYLENTIKIVYVGARNEYQRFDDVVKFLKYIKFNLRQEIQPIIISSFHSQESIELLKSQLGQNTIVFNGLKNAEVLKILKLSDYGIISRHNDVINRVAAPTKIAEYLLSGLHVLYTGDIGIIREVEKKFPKDTFINYNYHDSLLLKKRFASDREKIIDIAANIFDIQKHVDRLLFFVEQNNYIPPIQTDTLE